MDKYVWLVYQVDATTTMDVLKGVGTTEEEAQYMLSKLRMQLKDNAIIDPMDGEFCYDESYIKKHKANELFQT